MFLNKCLYRVNLHTTIRSEVVSVKGDTSVEESTFGHAYSVVALALVEANHLALREQ